MRIAAGRGELDFWGGLGHGSAECAAVICKASRCRTLIKAGDFGHFAIDVAGSRLFLTREANNVVEVLDLKSNTLAHTI
jgi:hypothetical protein